MTQAKQAKLKTATEEPVYEIALLCDFVAASEKPRHIKKALNTVVDWMMGYDLAAAAPYAGDADSREQAGENQ